MGTRTMFISTTEKQSLINIFVSQKLSINQASCLVNYLEHLEKYQGIVAVVTYLKGLKSALLQGVDRTTTVALNSKGEWKGPASFLRSKFNKPDRKEKARIIRILNVYGRWEKTTVEASDIDEFVATVKVIRYIKDPIDIDDEEVIRGAAITRRARFTKSLPLQHNMKVPLTVSAGGSSYRSDLTLEDHYSAMLKNCPNIMRRNRNFLNSIWNVDRPMMGGTWTVNGREQTLDWDSKPLRGVVGKISFLTKDRGLKVRCIANPLLGLQMSLSRLQDACNLFLQGLPESHVHDQESAISKIQGWCQEGRKLWSFDLSKATDHFPLSVQEHVLKTVFPGLIDDIHLFTDVCRGSWVLPDGRTQTYNTGQPMGLAPSFACFSITHTLLVRSLGGNVDNFVTCGDDIVIADKDLADRYLTKIESYGVKISLSKSLANSTKAEFVGRIIDKHGSWPVFKGNPLKISTDPFGYLRQYGLSAVSLYPKDIREMLAFFVTLPSFSGVKNLEDKSSLTCLPDELATDFYGSIQTEKFGVVTKKQKDLLHEDPISPPSYFEGQLTRFRDRNSGSIFGDGVTNTPRIWVDHVNINMRKTIFDVQPSFMEDLDFSSLSPEVGDKEEPFKSFKIPLKRLKSLWKKFLDSKQNLD